MIALMSSAFLLGFKDKSGAWSLGGSNTRAAAPALTFDENGRLFISSRDMSSGCVRRMAEQSTKWILLYHSSEVVACQRVFGQGSIRKVFSAVSRG